MRVVHLNATDAGGGAARSAVRLHTSLRGMGVDSFLVVQRDTTGAPGILECGTAFDRAFPRLRDRLDSLPPRRYPARRSSQLFTANVVPDAIPSRVNGLHPSIVNLHWVGRGFMRIESVARLTPPLVWTLHDSWPFTGGCHVPQDCERFLASCGKCPALGSTSDNDLSRRVWQRKAVSWSRLNLTLVAPSHWMARRAAASGLFRENRVDVIPNGVDTSLFRPLDGPTAKARLGIPPRTPTVLFAAMWAERDPNKGFHFLAPALAQLRLRGGVRPHLIVAGSTTLHLDARLAGVIAHSVGELADEAAMANVIAAADVVAVPSMQENFPNSALEAHACGRPVVAFDVGGMPDLVKHGVTGFLVTPFDVRSLAESLGAILDDAERATAMGHSARTRVDEMFDVETQARRYMTLYQELVPAGALPVLRR
jgi:glycosyltransferase involved in cell wall biosynthesis